MREGIAGVSVEGRQFIQIGPINIEAGVRQSDGHRFVVAVQWHRAAAVGSPLELVPLPNLLRDVLPMFTGCEPPPSDDVHRQLLGL